MQRQQDQNPLAMVNQMMGKPPRMPANLNSPLGDAQAFAYTTDNLSGEVEQLAASTNNPRYAAKMLGYDQNTFSEMLHVFKPQNGLGPADNVLFHDDGSVEFNGQMLDDNIHNYAPRRKPRQLPTRACTCDVYHLRRIRFPGILVYLFRLEA